MTRVFLCVTAALALPLSAFGQDGGTPVDAAPSLDAGVLPNADAGPAKQADTLEAIRLRLHRLGEAVAEGSDLDVPLTSLFGFDVEDPDAVKIRLEQIDLQVSRLDQNPALVRINTSSTSTASPALLQDALRRRALLAERAFLNLDAETRAGRIAADIARRTLEAEKAEAKERALQAAEEARAADAARLKALEEAEKAKTATIKRLKSRVAVVQEATGDLADRDQKLAEKQAEQSKKDAEALKKVQVLLDRELQVTGEAAVIALFGEIRAELKQAIAVLKETLGLLDERIDVPDLREDLPAVGAGASAEERAASAELQDALSQFDKYLRDVRLHQRAYRLQAIGAAHRRVSALADARVRLMKRLPADVRAGLKGLTREGLEEVRLEAELLALGAKTQPVLHADTVKTAPQYLKDVVTLGKTFWAVLKILFIIGFALWFRRRGPRISDWFDRVLRSRLSSMIWMRRYVFLRRNISAYGPYLLFLLVVHLVFQALGPIGEAVEVDLLFTTILWISYYWLIRTWMDATILWLAKRRRVALNDAMAEKLRRSTTLVARTVLIFGLLQSVAVRILRQGVLYHFARILLIGGAIAVVFIIIRWWRRSIAEAYLKKYPEGRLADLVRTTQDKVYNIFIVIAALGYVLVSGFVVLGKDFILGFEQSRKALAFVFRKRLERRSEKAGTGGSRLEELPERLMEAFTLEPLDGAGLRVDHFPGLPKLLRDLELWKKGHLKGSFLLFGSRGYGKTTWIKYALSQIEAEKVRFLHVQRRDASAQAIWDQLATVIGLEDPNHESLVAALNRGPKTVWALDDIHHLFFRTMGGCAGIDALMDLIEDTGKNVFWICAVDGLAWRHIQAVRPMRIRFRAEQKLDDWPEDKLRELLMARTNASGVAHEFEDLVVSNEDDKTDALVQASEGYTRLIWDYADGCPLVALRFWLHSLTPAGSNRVRVRLFKEPEVDSLQSVPEEGVFIYAAVASHGALSSEEASLVSGFPRAICESVLIRGVEAGYLRDLAAGRFALAIDWQRQLIRYLRARQAL